jgi:hypothetical protein
VMKLTNRMSLKKATIDDVKKPKDLKKFAIDIIAGIEDRREKDLAHYMEEFS